MPLRSSILMLLLLFTMAGIAQQKNGNQSDINTPKVDSIAFHLYTDSLKKGVYNYINVDGLHASGRWIPLTSQEIRFSCDHGRFEGNNLIIDSSCNEKMVNITAVYNRNPALKKSITVYLKTLPDNEHLKTKEEMLEEMSGKKKKRKKG